MFCGHRDQTKRTRSYFKNYERIYFRCEFGGASESNRGSDRNRCGFGKETNSVVDGGLILITLWTLGITL